jgi:phosphate transport system ATP-binding protein
VVTAAAEAKDDGGDAIEVSVRDLRIRYGSKVVLRDVSLDVKSREIFAIIGPANSGKTSFLRVVNRMDEFVKSMSLHRRGEGARAGRAGLAQSLRVAPSHRRRVPAPGGTAAQRLRQRRVRPAPGRHSSDKAELDAIVEKSLRRAALWDEVKDRLTVAGQPLVGGSAAAAHHRARAVPGSPKILLLDEFSIAVDPVTTMRIEDVLKELRDEMTIVLVTNLVQQAQRLADRTAFFYMGECVSVAPTEAYFSGDIDTRARDYVEGRFG